MEESNPVTREAGRIIAERLWAENGETLKKCVAIPLNQAAGMVCLSPENMRNLALKHDALLDFGLRNKRVSMEGMTRIMEALKLKREPKMPVDPGAGTPFFPTITE